MKKKLKSILLIIPYFGKFNNYFNLFLKSAEYNDTIDFLIITDDKRKFNYPKNVKVVYSTFEKESKRFIDYFEGKTRCDTPYKLVEYKPFYGEIYKKYAKRYDFWGNCETDLILGDIRKFITDDILEYFDKIYFHGHLALTKNNGYINSLLINSPVFPDIWHWSEALNIPNVNVHYDEFNGSHPTLAKFGVKIYDGGTNDSGEINYDYADIDQEEYFLSIAKYNNCSYFKNNEKLVFFFDKGKLYCKSETGDEREFSYMHLQKRRFDNQVTNLDQFIIIPNSIINYDKNFDLEKEFKRENAIADQNKNYYTKLLESYSQIEHRAVWQPKQEAIKILKEKGIWDYNLSKKIIILIPYFGKFNDYFDLFLESIKYNDTIDFLIITDDKRKFNYPKNVKVVYSTFEKERKRIISYFDFEVKCDIPYKLCDYRPFYGEIYKKYTKGYDFFGWCDTDIIFGDIRKFVTTDILNEFTRIYLCGCFTLIKNDKTITDILLNSPKYVDAYHCREAYKIGNSSFHYDEFIGSVLTLAYNGKTVYPGSLEYADINYENYSFSYYNWDNKYNENLKYIFYFDNGKLYSIDNEKNKREVVVLHLQKREMINKVTDKEKFIIIPNKFIEYNDNFDIDKEFENEEEYLKKHPNYTEDLYTRITFENVNHDYYGYKLTVLEKLRMLE